MVFPGAPRSPRATKPRVPYRGSVDPHTAFRAGERGSSQDPPDPSFDHDPLDAALSSQLEGLQEQGVAAERAKIGQNEARLREQLAQSLARTQRGHERTQHDLAVQMGKLEAEKPEAIERTKTDMSARGVGRGGIKQKAVAETRKDFDEALARGKLAVSRDVEDFTDTQKRLRQETEWQLQDVQYEKEALERDIQAGKIQSQGELQERRHGHATSWMTGRMRQLMIEPALGGGGYSPEQAYAVALEEAKAAFPGISHTRLAGSVDPDNLKHPVNPVKRKYGVEISSERASKIGPRKTRELRGRGTYSATKGALDEYVQLAGGRGEVDLLGFMSHLEAQLREKKGEIEALAALEGRDLDRAIHAQIKRNAHIISLAWADAGLD